MKIRSFFIHLLIITVMTGSGFLVVGQARAEGPSRVLILPFDINAEKDLGFLQKGIENMLSTRLFMEGKVLPLEREIAHQAVSESPGPINRPTAVALGQKYGADYVLFGSLTVFGESISTDSQFLDVNLQKPLVTFSEFGKDHGEVIQHVNDFAQQVNARVFGRKPHAVAEPAPARQMDDTTHQNPNKLWTGQESQFIYGDSDSAGYMMPGSQAETTAPYWKSQSFKTVIIGMAIGDVDGDQTNETVFIDDRTVYIYRKVQGRFIRIAEIQGSLADRYISVDVADINANGKAEIFVTSLREKNGRINSFVLEHNGSAFSPIVEGENWYFRVLNVKNRGAILLGQKQGSEQMFVNSIYELQWQNGTYEPGERQVLPKGITVYDFNWGNISGDQPDMVVAFDKNDFLRILDGMGNQEWKSSEPYGGSGTYVEPPASARPRLNRGNIDPGDVDRRYLAQRLHILDMDSDGKNEVVVVKNKGIAGRMLSRFRWYKSGHIECLAWDNVGLARKWRTREISGYISDYTVADMDNDGQLELIFSLATEKDSAIGKGKSAIVSQKIQQ